MAFPTYLGDEICEHGKFERNAGCSVATGQENSVLVLQVWG
jgi:hypothetical protein